VRQGKEVALVGWGCCSHCSRGFPCLSRKRLLQLGIAEAVMCKAGGCGCDLEMIMRMLGASARLHGVEGMQRGLEGEERVRGAYGTGRIKGHGAQRKVLVILERGE